MSSTNIGPSQLIGVEMDKNIVFEQLDNNFFPVLFEVARIRSEILKKIEKDFDAIRKNISDRSNIKQLQDHIKEFTGIQKVIVTANMQSMDAAIFPVYTRTLPKIARDDPKSITPENAHKYIRAIYVTLGQKLIREFPPKQLTAIILHELGHIYQHTSNLGLILPNLVNLLAKGGVQDVDELKDKSFVRRILTIPLIAALFPLSRSLTFSDHIEELKSDEYATRYGYGDELAKVFYKFSKWAGERRSSNWLGRVWHRIKRAFSLSSHPSDSERICTIIQKMKKDYKKTYPKLSKQISTIYADIKC